LLPSWALKPVE